MNGVGNYVEITRQLMAALHMLDETQYGRKLHFLHQSSIGQHVRHILDMFLCLQRGRDTGVVSYDHRAREKAYETDKEKALHCFRELIHAPFVDADQPVKLESVDADGKEVCMESSYFRELQYCVEHMIHHMAIIRIAMEQAFAIQLPLSFGVAPSTIRFQAGNRP